MNRYELLLRKILGNNFVTFIAKQRNFLIFISPVPHVMPTHLIKERAECEQNVNKSNQNKPKQGGRKSPLNQP